MSDLSDQTTVSWARGGDARATPTQPTAMTTTTHDADGRDAMRAAMISGPPRGRRSKNGHARGRP
jgi:hypothetical protein